MTEETCKRELELEIPAENVKKATEKISRDLARVARIPGFRPGKAPVTLIQRRFADEIKGEVLDSLLPDVLSQSLQEKKMIPVNQPQVDQVNFTENGPVKFRATFEVLPEFELTDYKGLEIEVDKLEIGDAEVNKAIEEIRERAATFAPVEGRAIQDGDFAQLKLIGTPEGGGEPVRAESVLCHIGSEETLESFNENLRGAKAGETKNFAAKYPDDYPDPKLGGKTYNYTVEVLGIKEKKMPELNDEFAKDVAGEKAEFTTLEEMRKKIREQLDAAREAKQGEQAREKILEVLIKKHDFPVPESLIEGQMDARLERVVRSLATQGVDPRAVNVDWVSLRSRQRQRATDDVKAEILLDRVATAENIDATEEEVEKQLEAMATASGESATSLRARLTKQGALDRMKSKLRSDKTIDWLYQQSRIQTTARGEK
ncbi:MAG: trigger factor [Candidatus Acidiferrales bacterium]